MAQATKKSFEFRMSKKVAELTQVVHMLFTRNHEKEVELEALKDAYEYEIECVIKDARMKIEMLEKRIRDLERDLVKGNTQTETQLKEALLKKDNEWEAKVKNLENLLQAEKKESQNSRDLLIQAQNDLERLREVQSKEVLKLNKTISDKTSEIDRLKDMIRNLENNLSDKQKKAMSANDLNRDIELLRKEVQRLKEENRATEKDKEQVVMKNQRLEKEIRALQKEINKRMSASMTSQHSKDSYQNMEYNDELERLRREIQRYRMELTNRETNFNRVFAEKNPVQVNNGQKQSKNIMMQQAFENGVVMRLARDKSNLTGLDLGREKTMSLSVSPTKSFADSSREEVAYEHFEYTSAITPRGLGPHSDHIPQGRLPEIQHTAESKARLQKLIKPKPLPRDMVTTRAGGH